MSEQPYDYEVTVSVEPIPRRTTGTISTRISIRIVSSEADIPLLAWHLVGILLANTKQKQEAT